MYVLKRNGIKEEVHFDKITSRIEKLCYNLNMDYVDPASITFSVISNLYSGITTRNLDNLVAETAAKMATRHPDYAVLAARIAITDLHKETKELFSDVINDLYNTVDPFLKRNMIDETYHEIIKKFKEQFNSAIVHDRDFIYDYFSYKILEKNFLMKINGKVVERPQHMFMRVAVAIHKNDYNKAIETYSYMSQHYFTHASSILISACSLRQQMSSCFILTMVDDSIEGIYDTLEKCAIITKAAGNVGLNVHNIRAKGTRISGINGIAQGLIPMLKVYNDTACYIDQGRYKKPGEFAIYLEPWHPDIFDYLNLKKETGKEELRAKQLVYALWIPDLFMKRVLDNEEWSLMCPHECPGLHNVYGQEFENLYTKYEKEKRYKRKIRARDLWTAILIIQTEIGSPYMVYKDHCNRKSNQQKLGTIKGGDLTTGVIQYSSPNEVAICNTATISLDKFIDNNQTFNFLKLKEIVKVIIKDLNKIMEIDCYPLEKTEIANLKYKSIGIGVQGLADTFILMRYPFESEAAQKLNTQIFETLYYGALQASCELAQEKGIYSTYEDSPTSTGILQYDMWNVTPTDLWDWNELKVKIAKYGIRNSLLIALIPTTSTAEILGNSESVEPYTSYINTNCDDFKDFEIVNRYLLKDLTDRDLWDEEMKNEIISNGGSIQNIDRIPHDLKQLYKTVWEIPQKTILKMAVDRAPFVDQSQALNVHIPEPTYAKLTSMHFYGWKMGLKTGMYNLKTKLPPNELQLLINKMQLNKTASMSSDRVEENHSHNYEESENDTLVCSRENGDECMMCGA